MGGIVYWTMIRIVIVIPVIWFLLDLLNYKYWQIWSFVIIYAVVIHPAYVGYKKFTETNREIFEDTICASCKHFDKSAVLCMKYDKHPKPDDIPCQGFDWEPQ